MPRSSDHTSSLPIMISPESGDSSPAMHRNRVVFPHPEGPRRVKILLGGVVRFTLSRAFTVSSLETNVLVKFLTDTTPCMATTPLFSVNSFSAVEALFSLGSQEAAGPRSGAGCRQHSLYVNFWHISSIAAKI